jgi:hypothetical protein
MQFTISASGNPESIRAAVTQQMEGQGQKAIAEHIATQVMNKISKMPSETGEYNVSGSFSVSISPIAATKVAEKVEKVGDAGLRTEGKVAR